MKDCSKLGKGDSPLYSTLRQRYCMYSLSCVFPSIRLYRALDYRDTTVMRTVDLSRLASAQGRQKTCVYPEEPHEQFR